MKYIAKIYQLKLIVVTACLSFLFVGCTEDIDTSARFTLKEYTILSYLEDSVNNKGMFTEYVRLLHQVPISSKSNSSTVAQLMSARGKYTCFAPDNQAIQDYLDTLAAKGIIDEASWECSTFRNSPEKLDSVRKIIVLNSIIDGSNNGTIYDMAQISSFDDLDEFSTANLNERKLYKTHVEQTDTIRINGMALIDLNNRDIETINGRVHHIHSVIAPSNDTMSDIFRQWLAEHKRGFQVMAKLILATGLEDTLSKTQDDVWERMYQQGEVEDLPLHSDNEGIGSIPRHRKYGFTIFAEPDELWESEMASVGINKTAEEITVEDVRNYLKIKGAYPQATDDENYTNENNLVNQFVTYHVLPVKLTRDKLVIHYNERGYNFKTSGKRYTIPVFEYYTTMGKRRLLKIFESGEREGIYLNCFPILRNGRGKYSPENLNVDDYKESGEYRDITEGDNIWCMSATENEGNKINYETADGANHEDLINGCIYPIENMLAYSGNVQYQLSRERIRMDIAAIFPEMINNDIRRPMEGYAEDNDKTRGFPTNYNYLADVQIQEGTLFYYLSGYDRGWFNYQGDELNIKGKYEFTMKLPPVPRKGHYEIRFGVSANSNRRSMCQVYFGDNLNYLPAAGIPMDLRIGFVNHRFADGNQTSNFGYTSQADYKSEANLSIDEQDEVTKALRARGFMKGPKYYQCGNELAMEQEPVTRRIMVSADLDPEKTYYIRFKNVLNNTQLQFFGDFLEFVSKDVYDNPEEPEDYW
ncbi:MAG: fasciclin domain-containing protein [Bacteroidales bacterium]|nr:fasciclin domain-containing protein [Bacteroidales bacterium]